MHNIASIFLNSTGKISNKITIINPKINSTIKYVMLKIKEMSINTNNNTCQKTFNNNQWVNFRALSSSL